MIKLKSQDFWPQQGSYSVTLVLPSHDYDLLERQKDHDIKDGFQIKRYILKKKKESVMAQKKA